MSFTLHKVTPTNSAHTIPALLILIKGLALFEKAPDSVHATEALLRKNLFGDAPYAECMLAYMGGSPEEGGKAVGMCLYYFTFSTWTGKGGIYLEDLYVEEPQRGQGLSKTFFRYLGNLAKEKDLARLDWVVLDWNMQAKEVYRKMGAAEKKEWEGMRLEGEALAKLAD